jgi:adenosylhomocysteine nucleosidase
LKGVGVVAALAAEARLFGSAARRADGLAELADGTLLALSGVGPAAAARAAKRLADAGARALLSFGLAGALDPSLSAGALVIPHRVISREGATVSVSPQWRALLVRSLGARRAVNGGDLLSSSRPIDSIEAKSAVFHGTGAAAVDMESLAVAQVAADRKLPFVALRVIVDTAVDRVPRSVMAASREGQVKIARLLGALALAPADILDVIRLARRYRMAMRALAQVTNATLLAPFSAEAGAA